MRGSKRAVCSARRGRSPQEIDAREEVGALDPAAFLGVRAMDGVLADARAELLSDRSLVRLGWIGRTDHTAPVLDRVVALERGDHHRAPAHERAELVEERPFAVDGVEAFGLQTREPELAESQHPKALALHAVQDLPRRALFHGVGFDDAQGALACHWISDAR